MPSVEFMVVLFVIEVIIYSFHASVLLLLFAKRKTTFKGPFYDIFCIVIIADLTTFVQNLFTLRVPLLFPAFFKTIGFFAAILHNGGAYFIVLQYFGHMLMAFNRFTLLWFPLHFERIWRRNWYTLILLSLPVLHVIYRVHEPGAFVFTGETNVTITLLNPFIMSLTFTTSAIIYAVTTCGAAIFNILSAVKYYLLKKKGKITEGNDKSLFFITCVIFIAQVIRFGYSMGRSLYTSNNPDIVAFLLIILPIVSDIYAWTGTISLLFLSRSTRNEYINFFTCKSKSCSVPHTTVTSTKQIRVS